MSQEAAGHVVPLETAARGRRKRWQTKIGRGDTDHNIYHIEDMERSECGASNGMSVSTYLSIQTVEFPIRDTLSVHAHSEWCTPRSTKNCSICMLIFGFIGIALMSFAFGLRINAFNTEYGLAGCGENNTSDFVVEDKIANHLVWAYFSGGILVICIVGVCMAMYMCPQNRNFELDEEGHSKKPVEEWDVVLSRNLCRCELMLGIFAFTSMAVWFYLTVDLMTGFMAIADAKNCSPDTVQEEAGDKVPYFIALVVLSVIGVCGCGMPVFVWILKGKSDEDMDVVGADDIDIHALPNDMS